jgi:hypothetical protein
MRSPRHLVVTVVVLGVLVTVVGLLVPKLTGSTSPGAAANLDNGGTSTAAPGSGGTANLPGATGGGGQLTSPPPSSLPTRQTSAPQTPISAPPAPQALETATLWAKAFVNHPQGITSEQWLGGLRPYTSEEYLAARMSTVDPANVPATEVTGPAEPITNYGSSVVVKVPTNAGALTLTVIQTSQGWRVVSHEQAAA